MNDLIVANIDDGFDVQEPIGAGMIVGKMLKFTIDGHFVADKVERLPANTTLVAMAMVTAWVHWDAGLPVEHRVTTQPGQHPVREELPDRDETKWPPGLDGKPADPWRDSRYVHMIDPNTGGDFTFVTETYGGRRAVGDLKAKIRNFRSVHPAAVPVVMLASTMMPTKFGPKPRPDFKITGWHGRRDDAPAPAAIAIGKVSKSAPAVTADAMDDDIPFD
jgi:hypothetical protein